MGGLGELNKYNNDVNTYNNDKYSLNVTINVYLYI